MLDLKRHHKPSSHHSILQSLIEFFNTNERRQLAIGGVVSVIFAVLYSIIIAHKYWQFEYFFVDNVYFHTALWKLSQFQTPLILHQHLGAMHLFGDHFNPAIFLIALLYRVIPSHLTILLSMSILYAIGGFFGVLIARRLRLPITIWLPLLGAYFLYIATQNSFLFGFHEVHLVPPVFLAACWAVLTKRWRTYWMLFIVLLLIKESMAGVALGLGLWMFFLGKQYLVPALATSIIAVGWYFLVTMAIIPHFSGGFVLYTNLELPRSAEELVGKLTEPPEKISTFLISIGSFGFLPLLQMATIPLVLQDFFIRYIFSIPGNIQHTLYYHYGAALAPILLFTSLWSASQLHRLKKFGSALLIGAIIAITATLIYSNLFMQQKTTLLLVFNPDFYQVTTNNAFLWELVAMTPTTGSVMTQNHLGLPLSNRPWTYMLAQNYEELLTVNPDYLVFDIREGQNPNNYFPAGEDVWLAIVEQALTERTYRVMYQQESLYILKKL